MATLVRLVMLRATTLPGGLDAIPGSVVTVPRDIAEDWVNNGRARPADDAAAGTLDRDGVLTMHGDPMLDTAEAPATRRRRR